jgi:hypothetical protein
VLGPETNVKSRSNNCRCKAGVPPSGHHHHFNAHQAQRCAAASVRPTHAWLTGFAESHFVVVLGKRMQPGQPRERARPPITARSQSKSFDLLGRGLALSLKRNWMALFLVYAARIGMVSCRGDGRPNKASVRIILCTAL